MPYFLNAPASIATNRDACNSETAGTATLMTLAEISAETTRVAKFSQKTSAKIKIVKCFIVPIIGYFFARKSFAASKAGEKSKMVVAERSGFRLAVELSI